MFLAILLHAKYLPIDEKEKMILERLYPLGELAARLAADRVEQSFEYLEMRA